MVGLSAKRADPGDPEFFRCVRAFEAECGHVHRALRRHGVHRQDAPDLVQEVFLVMWRRWGEFDASRELRPWLAGIAFKVAHGHHRRFWRREIPSEAVDPATDRPGPDDQLAHARARDLVLSALDRLAEKDRSVLVMHDIDGIPVREIAALAELPRFTVHTRLRRARARFEKILQALETGAGAGAAMAFTPAALLDLERRPVAAPPEARLRPTSLRALASASPFRPRAAGRWLWPVVGGIAATGLVLVLVAGHGRPSARLAAPAPAAASAPRRPRPFVAAEDLPRREGAAPPAAPTAAAPAIDAGLVGHWTFDEAAGSAIARDLSGHGHDCWLRALEPAAAWGPGHAGGAVDLGTKGWLECSLPPATGRWPAALSVAFWLRRDRLHTTSTLVDRSLGPGTQTFFHFALRGDALQLWSGIWSHTVTHELERPLEGWVHLAFTHAGRTTKLFIDGALVAQRDDTGPKNPGTVTTAPLVVGALVRDPTRAWQHLDGAIDDLRVYERALSNDEIAALAAAPR
jgi:RNA polymerase sigma-70 factor (ECF subfamily)